MSTLDVDTESIAAFHIDDEYLFSHYFDRRDLFTELSEYYDDEHYRFEIPADDFESVQQLLEENYYDLSVVEDPESYCVVINKYEEYADILRNSVVTWERQEHRFFLMKDKLAVKEAVELGADRLSETKFVFGV